VTEEAHTEETAPEAAADSPPGRIAVVMLTAIGDVVHALPVVNSLKAAWPGAKITWIVQPGPHGLVAGHPAVDEFIVFDRSRGLRGYARLRRELAGREFDLVLVLQSYLKAGLVTLLLRAPRKIGFDRARARDMTWLLTRERIPPRPRGHVQDEFLEFVEHLGVAPRREWGLDSTPEEEARYRELLPPAEGPTVAMVLSTSNPEKDWPSRNYAALADRLHDELGARSILVGGRTEREEAAARAVLTLAEHPPLDLRERDLRRLVYLLGRSDVLVSPDTGPLHVAVALGTPTVALMGATNPKRFGPYGRFGELMVDGFGDPGEEYASDAPRRSGRMARIGVDEVMEKVRRALELHSSGQSAP
jgi:heptosyltransferase I